MKNVLGLVAGIVLVGGCDAATITSFATLALDADNWTKLINVFTTIAGAVS